MTDTPTPPQAPEVEEGRAQALSYAADIAARIAALRAANAADDYAEADRIDQELNELPLEVSWRAHAWQTTTEAPDPDEYRILLSWGGPSVQITGDLDMDGDPVSWRLEWSDWFKPWAEVVPPDEAQSDAIRDFVAMVWGER